jgi:hypothetical protein
MPLDQAARNRLFKFVTDARRAVSADLAEQMQSTYGLGPDGSVTPVAGLQAMGRTEGDIGVAKLLAERLEHLVAQAAQGDERRPLAFARLARELSFGIVNRLAAIRMAESRLLVPPMLAVYHASDGFVVFRDASHHAFATQHEAYVQCLRCVCDEMATDLGAVMDSRAHNALLFPREACLGEVVAAMNHGDLAPLWGEDETIGWIYQYYNDPDERKLMREASQTPRDSRELAIRNQFFTPRYVVEFLTDNTLGRLWYEMTQGSTALVQRCRYLVRRPQTKFLAAQEKPSAAVVPPELPTADRLQLPEEVLHRPLKDPRELRFLDPACGSMHFGLYAFDLLELIYAEAWDRSVGTLRADYPVREDFLREVPRLILEHNIYGVDIDARAVQIARLALWLRAQKAWQQQRLQPARRPRILRSHVVCAEPISADQAIIDDFIATTLAGTPEKDALGRLMRRLVDQMRLVGEAGVLLRIEETIKQLISSAAAGDRRRETPALPGLAGAGQRALQDDLAGFSMGSIADAAFWDQAEQRLYQELNRFATRLEQGGLRRRMFAEDAAQGFAFVDLCRERFDVVVMNPPFGEWSAGFKKQSKELYPNSYCDILAAFVERGGELLHPGGRLGAITSRTCFFLSSYTKWREEVVLKAFEPKLLVDLGHGVMDEAMVEAAAYVFLKPNA